jgi:hypothetical protein
VNDLPKDNEAEVTHGRTSGGAEILDFNGIFGDVLADASPGDFTCMHLMGRYGCGRRTCVLSLTCA